MPSNDDTRHGLVGRPITLTVALASATIVAYALAKYAGLFDYVLVYSTVWEVPPSLVELVTETTPNAESYLLVFRVIYGIGHLLTVLVGAIIQLVTVAVIGLLAFATAVMVALLLADVVAACRRRARGALTN
ncbi:hypothetical protein [Natrinema sp. DC36]|uniref:hypothetical protein n=1 Tax=Natrinema sp. DC36 TaxID=2878680 RepID=UPI001CF0CE76|nr:hypothetical protein [Natrinema sp. DC36]